MASVDKSRRRVQLDLNKIELERLKELRKKLDAPSNTEVIRKSLRLMEWFLTQKESNSEVQVVNGKGVKGAKVIII